jgi:hypothetical protein
MRKISIDFKHAIHMLKDQQVGGQLVDQVIVGRRVGRLFLRA